jgi:hypothetical protein
MGANDSAVHDQVFKIRIVSHCFENAKPNTLLAPAAKAAEYAVPLAKGFRYQRISQGSSRSLALYCLGSCETQREASVTQDGE